MRKLTVIAALLGSVYFANAQVGIGTPDPALSAELDIVSKDKGILIPRVELTDIKVYAPIVGNQQESLLVYNTNVDAANELLAGFYYWDTEDGTAWKWNRIVSKTELDQTIKNIIDGDITNIINDVKSIQDVINYILPSNPDNTTKPEDLPKHTTIVYNNVTKTFQEVTYDVTKETYITKEIDLTELIRGYETVTVVLPVLDTNGKTTGYKYYNEQDVQKFLQDPANKGKTHKDITTATPGGVVIDVKGNVVNNIKEILESNTTIVVDGITFTTVEEYLQYITQFSKGNVIYEVYDVDINGVSTEVGVFHYWDGAKYVEIDIWEAISNLETKTNLLRSIATENGKLPGYSAVEAPVVGDVKVGEIFYQYKNEAGVDQYVNMTGDILHSIENNEEIKNAITNVLNQGGNVYFGDHDGSPSTPDVLYSINEKGEKTPIDITSTIIEVINQNIDNIKNILGDKITVGGDTYVNTGNTINGFTVFKVMASTTVERADKAAGVSARTTGITLPSLAAGQSIEGFASFTILDANNTVVTNNVTDVQLSGNQVIFNLGTGNHYNALETGNYSVIVEVLIKQALVPITPKP